MRCALALFGMAFIGVAALSSSAGAAARDPFLWLEEAHGDRARSWVQTQNAVTLSELKADPAYEQTRDAAEQILDSNDVIPRDLIAGGNVFSFLQDGAHLRGLWRRATLASYTRGSPDWEPLLDLDALSAAQNTKWTWRTAKCLPPEYSRCLIMLSRDARETAVLKEFDISTKAFVSGGFSIGDAVTSAEWVDIDTLLLTTNWGKGSLTNSGSPRVAKIWSRGQDLRLSQAVYEGERKDQAIQIRTVFSPGGKVALFVLRKIDSANAQLFHVSENGRGLRVTVPSTAVFKGMHQRQLLFHLLGDWRIAGQTHPQGSVVSFSLDQYLANAGAMPKVHQAYLPNTLSAITDVATSRDAVYVSLLENVQGRVNELTFDGRQWLFRRVALPDNGAVEIVCANELDGEVTLKFAGFLTPDSLYVVRKGMNPKPLLQLLARFDADGAEVVQFEATSADGARIPYYIVRKTGAEAAAPMLLYAYGGFRISTTPWYWSSAGKLWLEKGGAYAVANIRGGGEFGPSWHAAATRENRQRNFDDLAAVARDMIERRLTSPRRLGILGSSQGGLLVAATFVQHPELFNAVVSQVPLTDMLRYTKIAANQNWISEYGDPADPVMRDIIAQWSPYQNVKAGVKYPNVFFLTSTLGGRVHPAHARKMAAKMAALGQPVLFYEDAQAANLRQRAEQMALTYTYFRRTLMN